MYLINEKQTEQAYTCYLDTLYHKTAILERTKVNAKKDTTYIKKRPYDACFYCILL